MIHYNELKHHALSIQQFVSRLVLHNQKDWNTVIASINQIGNRTLDLYIGELSAETAKKQLVEKLQSARIYSQDVYQEFIGQQTGQFLVEKLSDSSEWVLRIGRPPLNVVHIHPGRYSPHTIRTHGNALKTAIMIILYSSFHLQQSLSIVHVNELRKKIGLSPVRKMEDLVKIKKLLSLLSPHSFSRII